MARDHLPQELIDAGKKILEATDALDMQAQGAMWVHDHSLEDWRFYLVTSLVDTLGRRKTYGFLLDIFDRASVPKEMTVDDVHLGSPKEEFFQLISGAMRIENGNVRIKNSRFNGVLFDGYVYRSVNEIPTSKQAEAIQKRFVKRVKDISCDKTKRNYKITA